MTAVQERLGAPGDEDLQDLARRLRPADARELHETMGVSPLGGLRASVDVSDETWAYYENGVLIAVAGVNGVPLLRIGSPWFLGSPEVRRHRKTLMRTSRRLIARWAERFDRLENVVAASHGESIEYLQRLGFTITPPHVNSLGYAVHPFYMET